MSGSAPSFTRKQKNAFFTVLADTACITAAAKASGISRSRVYAERKKCAAFHQDWHAALCDGYDRLEQKLLADSLKPVSTRAKDATIRARQVQQRIGLMLLNQHRATVRGDGARVSTRPRLPRDAKSVRARLEAKFSQMRERMGDDD